MKRWSVVLLLTFAAMVTYAQTMNEVMEKRSREMIRVIALDDKEAWKKFIQENFTQALIDKQMRATVDTGDGRKTETAPSQEDKLEGKARMFRQLHDDFGKGKISALKAEGDQVKLTVDSEDGGMAGVFTLTFDRKSPYLISGLGIQVEAGN